VRVNAPLLPITGPVFRLTVNLKAPNGQIYQNIHDYMGGTFAGVNTAVVQAFLTAWIANCQVKYALCFGTDVSITGYTVAVVNVSDVPTLVQLTGGVPGTEASLSIAGTVAAVMTKYSSIKGQHGRGRVYFGPVPATFVTPATDPNAINAHGFSQYNTLGNALLLPVAAGLMTFSWAITTRPALPVTVVSLGVPVTSQLATSTMGNVRRRREGRGI
jgi:hypothetical protein